ncbi:hypothetical protein FISHEDRAFT_49790 [Fistulina hepatica ATCC 64428]|uniref:Copper transport protein n=1 Tax=Fistulina hepatica ATCC 64428 TaxID=1128425 RepID=A0A0D7A2D1_9AGAR|nr:hypothetical protein FISHEDRAFT_49790 [Fistulina hepatica ATCC 64428]
MRNISLSILILVLYAAAVRAMDMDMGGTTVIESSGSMSYLHFTRGDILWLVAWNPVKPWVVFGACVGLFLLSVLERLVNAARIAGDFVYAQESALLSPSDSSVDNAGVKSRRGATSGEGARGFGAIVRSSSALLTFISSQFPRALMQMAHSALMFALMLAVMTFQLSFILSIAIGSGVGEMMFGRISSLAYVANMAGPTQAL